jgi:hypothetical protein
MEEGKALIAAHGVITPRTELLQPGHELITA